MDNVASTVSTFTPDNLIVGVDLVTDVGTIQLGQGILARGTVFGKVAAGAVTKAAKTGGNTGDGTLVLDETAPALANVLPGVYKVRITRAHLAAVGTTPAVPLQFAIATLTAPDGDVVAEFNVATSAGTTVASHVKFVMVDGSTKFALGDGFDITVAAGSGELIVCDKVAIDGSAVPFAILADYADATSAAVSSTVYIAGSFDSASLIFASGTTAANVKDAARGNGMYFVTIKPAV